MLKSALPLVQIIPIICYLFSAINILALRGFQRSTNYMVAGRLFGIIFLVINILQYYGTPYYMQTLWNPIHLLMGFFGIPPVFAYAYSLMHRNGPGWRFWVAVSLPAILFITLSFIFRHIYKPLPPLTNYEQIKLLIHYPELWVRFGSAFLYLVEITVFTVVTFVMLQKHKKKIESEFSYTEGVSLGWLWWIVAVLFFEGVLVLSFMAFEGVVLKAICGIIFTLEPTITTVFVIQQKDLYKRATEKDSFEVDLKKEEDNILDEEQPLKREILKQKLLELLEKEEIFKDPELDSEKVRAMLYTNRTYLSKIINQDLGTNFYNLINTYRLNKAINIMKTTPSMPLKNIAKICGFKSLSAFSIFFRQNYNASPSEWRKQNL